MDFSRRVARILQYVAIVLFYLGITVCVVMTAKLWSSGDPLFTELHLADDQSNFVTGLMVLLGGGTVVLIFTLLLYGFGSLMDHAATIARQNRDLAEAMEDIRNFVRYSPLTRDQFQEAQLALVGKKKCPHCGAANDSSNQTCFACTRHL